MMHSPLATVRRLALGLLLCAMTAVPTAAQEGGPPPPDDRWQLTLDSGDYIWDIRLIRLDGDALHYRQGDSTASVSVERLTEVRRIRKTVVRLGEGEAAGAINALTGADDEIYDLAPLDYGAKLRVVQQLLLRRSAP